MSDNPFKSQSTDSTPPAAPDSGGVVLPPTAPGALTPILVFCLIFGIFGLMGTCLGGVMIFALEPMLELAESAGAPEADMRFSRLSLDAQKSVMLPGLIVTGLNLIVATMLIIGAFGCFKRKEPSRVFMRTALLAAIVYSVLKIAATLYGYFAGDAATRAAIEKLKDDPLYDSIQSQYVGNQLVGLGSIVFTVVIGLVMLAFYFWARSYLNKSAVIEHFAEVERYKQSSGA